jgi:hypothetical protein
MILYMCVCVGEGENMITTVGLSCLKGLERGVKGKEKDSK